METPVPVAAEEIRTRDQVDEAARLDSHTAGPHYPDSLFHARVAGRVVVEFVVDTTGAVLPKTIDILATTHPLFASAVRTSLEVARFTPAVVGGRKVRQYVQLPFTFAVRDSLPPR
jgi:TonB family protein